MMLRRKQCAGHGNEKHNRPKQNLYDKNYMAEVYNSTPQSTQTKASAVPTETLAVPTETLAVLCCSPVEVFIHTAGQQHQVAAVPLHADQRQLHGLVLVGLGPAQEAQHLLATLCNTATQGCVQLCGCMGIAMRLIDTPNADLRL